jgi:hypothetical protein
MLPLALCKPRPAESIFCSFLKRINHADHVRRDCEPSGGIISGLPSRHMPPTGPVFQSVERSDIPPPQIPPQPAKRILILLNIRAPVNADAPGEYGVAADVHLLTPF